MKTICNHCGEFKECVDVGRWQLCHDHSTLKQYAIKFKKTYSLKKTPLKKNHDYKIPRQSIKSKVENKKYVEIAKAFKAMYPLCQAKIEGVCTVVTKDVHHKKGRIGKDESISRLINQDYFLAVCRECHQYIENNVSFSLKKGFTVSRNKIT